MSEPTNIEILRICAATLKIELPADEVLEKESSAYGFLPGWDVLRALYNAGRTSALARAEAICRDQAEEWARPPCDYPVMIEIGKQCFQACARCADEIEEARLLIANGEGEG